MKNDAGHSETLTPYLAPIGHFIDLFGTRSRMPLYT